MRQVSTQRSHTRAPADIDHLPLRGFDMEIAERSDGCNDFSWLQAEHVAGTNPGSTILAWRGRGNTHIEAEQMIRMLVAGQRIIVSLSSLGIVCHQIKDMLPLPHLSERLRNIKVPKVDRIVRGNVQLQVVSGGEGDLFPGIHRLENQLLDEGSDIGVAHYP